VDRAIDLACHEGYPGHHVYNASLERNLVNDLGWVEVSVYPLFSPQSFIAEGTANYGIDMAFPGESRTAFERDTLYPLAGLDPSLAQLNSEVNEIMLGLNHARNEVARRYLDGAIDSATAIGAMARYWLQSPEQAAKTLRFIQQYRSYVINYNLGRDLAGAYIERESGGTEEGRWRALTRLLSTPRLAADIEGRSGIGDRRVLFSSCSDPRSTVSGLEVLLESRAPASSLRCPGTPDRPGPCGWGSGTRLDTHRGLAARGGSRAVGAYRVARQDRGHGLFPQGTHRWVHHPDARLPRPVCRTVRDRRGADRHLA
jgi:hypothetical protein